MPFRLPPYDPQNGLRPGPVPQQDIRVLRGDGGAWRAEAALGCGRPPAKGGPVRRFVGFAADPFAAHLAQGMPGGAGPQAPPGALPT
eukprot:6521363-Alexandrium_andersonii.AAC.1